jgi:hypothetical protein
VRSRENGPALALFISFHVLRQKRAIRVAQGAASSHRLRAFFPRRLWSRGLASKKAHGMVGADRWIHEVVRAS